MKNTILSILVILFFAEVISGQDQFHRTYPSTTQENFQVLDGVADPGGYFFLATIMPTIPGESEALFFGAVDYKGDELWSKRVEFTGQENLLDVGEMIIAANDSIYYAVLLEAADGSPYRILGSLDKNGRLGSSRIISDGTDANIPVLSFNLADYIDNSLLTATTYSANDTIGIVLSRMNYDSTLVWSNGMVAFDTLDNQLPVQSKTVSTFMPDSSVTMSGNLIDDFVPNSFITKVDSSGNVVWARKYRATANNSLLSSLDLIETADSSFIQCGVVSGDAYVARMDTMGELLWAKQFSMGDTTRTIIDNVTVDAGGRIVCSGTISYTNSDTITGFILLLDGGGNIIAQNRFSRTQALQNGLGELNPTPDGGSAIFTTNSDYEALMFVPTLIKTNEIGGSMCQDTFGITSADFSITMDTLVWSARSVNLTSTLVEASDNKPMVLDIPVLSLNVRPFCPNEPIDWTFDPRIEGKATYLWSDGSTADTLRVFEEGEYTVTVTMDEKICFTMCDTVMLTVYEEPSLISAQDNGPFCETGNVNLLMQYTGEAPLDSIVWSTGEKNVSVISVNMDGQYSVTVTDVCGLTADSTLNVSVPKLISTIDLELNEDYCTNGGILLSVTADGPIMSYQWFDNTTGPTNTVNLPGRYIVTVTDICGNQFSDNIDVDPSLIKEISNVQISTGNGANCVLNELTLTATWAGDETEVRWNTGESGASITINSSGTYTVEVVNECGDVEGATLDITECPECVTYPVAFFPQGMEDMNKTFGPYPIVCGQVISSYELKVFNRWGQLVFESANVDGEWDGMHGGDLAPSGVYVYYAKYDAGAGEQLTKGDVTLLR